MQQDQNMTELINLIVMALDTQMDLQQLKITLLGHLEKHQNFLML